MKPLDEKTYLEQAMKNGKGVSWFDDCRIPTGDSDKYDLEQREVSKAHGVQNDDSFLDQIHDADAKHGVQEKGRFPANVVVSDDSLNNGVESESIRSKRGGSKADKRKRKKEEKKRKKRERERREQERRDREQCEKEVNLVEDVFPAAAKLNQFFTPFSSKKIVSKKGSF